MNICILHIGASNNQLKKKHKSSPVRFQNLLSPFLPNAKWSTIHCLEESLPNNAGKFDAYLITGGKYSVFENFAWQNNLLNFIQKIYSANIPLLGVCYGAQYIAHFGGGKVVPSNKREYGRANLNYINKDDLLFKNVPPNTQVWMSHSDTIKDLPTNAKCISSTKDVKNAAY